MSNYYEAFVMSRAKPGQDIIDTLTPTKAHLLHMAVGVAGESGELLDAIKKHVVYNKPLDIVNVIEELGDLEFYMAGLRAELEVSRELILDHNIAKLTKRYAKGYSDKAAQERADKSVSPAQVDTVTNNAIPQVPGDVHDEPSYEEVMRENS